MTADSKQKTSRVVIVTRYNLRLSFPNVDPGKSRPTSEWLDHRKGLFETFCFPSVINQSDEMFLWYILFDPETDPRYVPRLGEVARPIFATSMKDAHDQIRADLVDRDEYFITTRLDNDDAISFDFVETIRSLAVGFQRTSGSIGLPMAVTFRRGVELDLADQKLFRREYAASPFFSVIEGPKSPLQLAFASEFHHAKINKEMPVCGVASRNPMWLVVVHDRNVGNTVQGVSIEGDIQKILHDRFHVTI